MRGVLKFSIIISGDPFVTMDGADMKPRLSVECWDIAGS
jgi:hypothetical protein